MKILQKERKKKKMQTKFCVRLFLSRLKILIYVTVMYTRTFTIKPVQFFISRYTVNLNKKFNPSVNKLTHDDCNDWTAGA